MSILKSILNAGIEDNMKLSDEARLKILNGSIFVAAFNIIIYNIMFIYFAPDIALEMSLFRYVCSIFILLAWKLNKKGKTKYSIHLLLIFSMISVFYVTYFYLGPDYGFQIYFTIFSVFPFVYFSSEQTLLRLFYAFLNLSCYFFLEIGRYNYVFTQDYKYYNSSIASMYKHMNIIIGFTAIVLVMYMYEYIIRKDEKALKIALENARYHAEYDYLTDTLNRRILSEYIREHMTEELSVIMWDVDDFKKINDVYGHAVGDQVLISLCNLVKKEITRECKFSRWGGEEFLILVEDISYNRVLDIAEKIRHEISESQIIEGHKVTISIGVTKKRRDDSFKTLLSRVDDLMYQAKKNGKNIVIESC